MSNWLALGLLLGFLAGLATMFGIFYWVLHRNVRSWW